VAGKPKHRRKADCLHAKVVGLFLGCSDWIKPMKVIRFEIEKFKGILRASINLSDEIPGNVITLIGLNESGKTTILEAILHFFTED
jgi:predicted AAA+ superfamily ATPase